MLCQQHSNQLVNSIEQKNDDAIIPLACDDTDKEVRPNLECTDKLMSSFLDFEKRGLREVELIKTRM